MPMDGSPNRCCAPSFGPERRSGLDRRWKKTLTLRSLFLGGKRDTIRRQADRQTAFYVDRYRQSLFAVIVGILFLSVLDAILTLLLISHGAVEINPVMAFYLDVGPYVFLLVKYALTSAGVLILLIFRNIAFKSMRVRAGAFLYLILLAFLSVVYWEISLVHQAVAEPFREIIPSLTLFTGR